MGDVILEHHQAAGHCGVKRLVKEMGRRCILPRSIKVFEEVRKVRQSCPICQACDPPNWNLKAPLVPTPIPEHIMTSVCLDVFALPKAQWEGNVFDSLVLCVDRLSGWIIARPTTKEGLTAKKTAHILMDNGWETFGIPAIITSDQGSQFVGQWFRTMCSRLGIRLAYSQAYRPQANGRAEVAGKTLIAILRKYAVELKQNWVEMLPRILKAYHDTPGKVDFRRSKLCSAGNVLWPVHHFRVTVNVRTPNSFVIGWKNWRKQWRIF